MRKIIWTDAPPEPVNAVDCAAEALALFVIGWAFAVSLGFLAGAG